MTSIIVPDTVLAVLGQAPGVLEIRDGQGKVVGYFAPAGINQAKHFDRYASRIDHAELARRKADPSPRLTTLQVFEHLLTLAADERDRADLQSHIQRLRERDACNTP